MALIQRGVRTIRSREDYDLFRIVFPNYDPRRILSIHLRIAPGQLIKPGVPFATITICSDSNSQQQQAPQQSYELSIQQPGRV
jgi:hypothetical protein